MKRNFNKKMSVALAVAMVMSGTTPIVNTVLPLNNASSSVYAEKKLMKNGLKKKYLN